MMLAAMGLDRGPRLPCGVIDPTDVCMLVISIQSQVVHGQIDVLNAIFDSCPDEFVQGFFEPQINAGPLFAILGAQKVAVMMKRVEAQRQFLIQEPWFDERKDFVLPFETNLQAQTQLLAPAREARPIEEIKIALGDFDETKQAVDGTESRAER